MYRLKSPLAAQVELTEACNNECRHCYNYWRFKNTGEKITACGSSKQALSAAGDLHRVIDILIEQEVLSVTLTGGEPFLQRGILYELIAKSKAAGQRVSINTNAALITPDDVDKIKAAEVDLVVVSLLSHQAATHDMIAGRESHAKTITALQSLLAAQVPVLVNMVVSRLNYNDVGETAEAVRQIGIQAFAATPVLACATVASHCQEILLSVEEIKRVFDSLLAAKEHGMNVDVLEPVAHCMFTAKERKRYSHFLQNRTCSAGISDAVVAPNGDIRPCVLSDEIVGNILREGWDACWQRLERWCKPAILPHRCLQCAVVDDCGGGCRVAALSMNGSITAPDPYMTLPINEAYPSNTTEGTCALPSINFSHLYAFPPAFIARTEAFGGVIGTWSKVIFLHQDAFALINILLAKQNFSLQGIFDEVSVDAQDVKQLLSLLLAKGFLIATADKKGGESACSRNCP